MFGHILVLDEPMLWHKENNRLSKLDMENISDILLILKSFTCERKSNICSFNSLTILDTQQNLLKKWPTSPIANTCRSVRSRCNTRDRSKYKIQCPQIGLLADKEQIYFRLLNLRLLWYTVMSSCLINTHWKVSRNDIDLNSCFHTKKDLFLTGAMLKIPKI